MGSHSGGSCSNAKGMTCEKTRRQTKPGKQLAERCSEEGTGEWNLLRKHEKWVLLRSTHPVAYGKVIQNRFNWAERRTSSKESKVETTTKLVSLGCFDVNGNVIGNATRRLNV